MSKRILVIEDNRDIRNAIVLMLSPLGCSSMVATTRDEGLERLKGQYVNLILTDYVMPGMGIVEFHRKVKKLRPEAAIIVYSAFDSIADEVERLGFAFMRKPFDEGTLQKYVVQR